MRCQKTDLKRSLSSMSDKAHFQEGEHQPALVEGPATALSWLTVLPITGATAFDRITGARVMASLPLVGLLLGAIMAGISFGLSYLSTNSLLVGVAVTVCGQLLTRFMHLDGLADVADALGSYAPPDKAREILADPHAGLIGMAAALLSLLVQIAAIVTLIEQDAFWAIFFLPVIGRLCGMVAAHRSFQPMKPTGFAALIIGTVPSWWIVAWLSAILLVSGAVALWAGDSSVVVTLFLSTFSTLILALILARHCNRRLGGLNGDTCGFIIEISTSFSAFLLALGLS